MSSHSTMKLCWYIYVSLDANIKCNVYAYFSTFVNIKQTTSI